MKCVRPRRYMILKCIDAEMLTAVNIHRERNIKFKTLIMENCPQMTTFLSTCGENDFFFLGVVNGTESLKIRLKDR